MSDDVVSLGIKTNDGLKVSPIDSLKEAIKDYEDGTLKGSKLLILSLNDSEGSHDIRFLQSGMKSSECIALCEISKSVFLELMGY